MWFIIVYSHRFIDLENEVPRENRPNWLKHDSQTRLMLLILKGGWPQFPLIILTNNVCSYCITTTKIQKAQRCFTFLHVERFFFFQSVMMWISHYVPYTTIFSMAHTVSKIWKWKRSKIWRFLEEVSTYRNWKARQYNSQKGNKYNQRPTLHYAENLRSSNTNSFTNVCSLLMTLVMLLLLNNVANTHIFYILFQVHFW